MLKVTQLLGSGEVRREVDVVVYGGVGGDLVVCVDVEGMTVARIRVAVDKIGTEGGEEVVSDTPQWWPARGSRRERS
jgi:hypothetical protein